MKEINKELIDSFYDYDEPSSTRILTSFLYHLTNLERDPLLFQYISGILKEQNLAIIEDKYCIEVYYTYNDKYSYRHDELVIRTIKVLFNSEVEAHDYAKSYDINKNKEYLFQEYKIRKI